MRSPANGTAPSGARVYGYAPDLAEKQALTTLSISALSAAERQSIRDACHQVITADGLVHPVELGALHRVERAFGIGGSQDDGNPHDKYLMERRKWTS